MSKEAVEALLDDLFNKYGVPDSERATIRAALQQQEGQIVGYARIARFRAGGNWQIEGTTYSRDGAHRWLEVNVADVRQASYEYAIVPIQRQEGR